MLLVNFYRSIKEYGIDRTVLWHIEGGVFVMLLAVATYLLSLQQDSAYLEAASGMLAITGVPVLLVAGFVFLWISMFFKSSWREAWLSLLDADF